MEDVIKKIYTQMEFDLFDDEDEVDCSDSIPSSSNQEFSRVDRGRSHLNSADASTSTSASTLWGYSRGHNKQQEKTSSFDNEVL